MSNAAALSLSSFDAEQPEAFYLLENRAGLEPLADATLVVEGVELPVHSQVRRFCSGKRLCIAGAPWHSLGSCLGSQFAKPNGWVPLPLSPALLLPPVL